MKFSYQWLKELSGSVRSADEIAEAITARSFEVEDVAALGDGLDNVVVGHVVSKEKHPDADRLNVAQVDVGGEVSLQIVCGAPNLEAGQKVPVALVGAKLPTEDGAGFKIKKGKIRGVESNGMICGEDEVIVGAPKSSGIMVLAAEAEIGTSFAAHMGLDDSALDIDILPNRAHDALGHIGVAREVAAVEGRVFVAPTAEMPAVTGAESVSVDVATELCPRYTATVIDGVDNTVATPQWMVARLTASGLRPISPIVDITNYVMLETGQPTHVFDAAHVGGGDVAIGVRTARGGEKMVLLDESEVELDVADVVIMDVASDAPVALAGVMGGLESGVSAQTTRVAVEAAAFDAAAIRATRSRHNVTSDAAYRFERELSPEMVAYAQARVTALIAEICGGVVTASAEHYPVPVTPWSVSVNVADVVKLLGVDVDRAMCVDLLTRVGVVVSGDGDVLECVIPVERLDLTTTADVIEEIGRLYGYENIAPVALGAAVAAPAENAMRVLEHGMRDKLVAQNFVETKGYSFYSADDAVAFGMDADRHVKLMNPMSAEQVNMRRSGMPTIVRAVSKSVAHVSEVRVFEVGRTYTGGRDGQLPTEHHVVTIAVASKATDGSQFFALKGAVDTVLAQFGVRGYRYDDGLQPEGYDHAAGGLHPGRRARIRFGNRDAFGAIGEVKQKTARALGVKNVRVAVAEISLDEILAMRSKGKVTAFVPLAKFPTVERDLSMIVGARTRVADLERVLSHAGGKLLKSVDLFDLYVNPESEERSMAFRFTFGADDRTLTSDEVDAAITKMIAKVEENDEVNVKKS